jgi:two-component system CheB/CheR fusion protein
MSEQADNKTNEAYKGVKSVLDGHAPRFCMEYPCHSPDEKRFFAMEVVAISHPQFAAVVSHFNISSWKNMEDENI